jgi:hypothetical protein
MPVWGLGGSMADVAANAFAATLDDGLEGRLDRMA